MFPHKSSALLACLILGVLGLCLAAPLRTLVSDQQGAHSQHQGTMHSITLARNLQPKRLWDNYMQHLHRSPVATKTVTSVVATILGDALAQKASQRGSKRSRYDWARTARFTLFNGILMGPLGHFYYSKLDGGVMPGRSTSPAAVAAKVVIDQLIWAPICTLVFYAWKCASEGRPGELRQELRTKYGPTMLANWKLWPAAHVLNFTFVPSNQRILFANVVSVLGVYILSRAAAGDLSSMQHKAQQAQQAQQQRGEQEQQQPAPQLLRARRGSSRQLQQQEEGGMAALQGAGKME